MNRLVDVTTSYASSVFSLGLGLGARIATREPEKPLELYEFESCPFCRKVREAFTEMDVSPIVYPCPQGGTRYRDVVNELGGKKQFPFLVDPNNGRRLYESIDIIRYVAETYGDGRLPLAIHGGPLNTMRSSLASLPRGRVAAVSARAPEKPLELWSFESSPYCRIAREALCRARAPVPAPQRGQSAAETAQPSSRARAR